MPVAMPTMAMTVAIAQRPFSGVAVKSVDDSPQNGQISAMQTNIEKLAEELSAIVAPYPNPLDCNSATISSEGGKHQIVMDHWISSSFKFTFDFEKVMPFHRAGG